MQSNCRVNVLGIGRQAQKGDGNGSNERIFVDRYVDGGTKPRSGNNRYENQIE